MLYVFYIMTTPYLLCNNINRKELYDFYYTAITLTTEYKFIYKHLFPPQVLASWLRCWMASRSTLTSHSLTISSTHKRRHSSSISLKRRVLDVQLLLIRFPWHISTPRLSTLTPPHPPLLTLLTSNPLMCTGLNIS